MSVLIVHPRYDKLCTYDIYVVCYKINTWYSIPTAVVCSEWKTGWVCVVYDICTGTDGKYHLGATTVSTRVGNQLK